ncbi:MAG: TetR/AcrR family transcriptional regulator [Ideonella sp.]|nr:TetR/AcrR family transcriptional regulator [Ideonella sp.]MCC7458288.1 TetR family transcriptional regulator [Nitrospira sp.]
MARIAGKATEKTVSDMKRAAIRLIARHGFEGMNLRELADEIGVKAGSFYNHIESKESLLHTLLSDTMHELIAGLDAASAVATDPADALRRFVAFHIEFHAVRRDEVFIGNAELRSLSTPHRAQIVAMRDAYEKRLLAILRAGRAAGVFAPGDLRVAAYALIALLSGVCNWYRPGGRLGVRTLVRQYTRMAFGCVGADPARAAPAAGRGVGSRAGPGGGTNPRRRRPR